MVTTSVCKGPFIIYTLGGGQNGGGGGHVKFTLSYGWGGGVLAFLES